MSPYLRSQVSINEATMTTQNLALLSALDDPILIIDPYQVSLEYLGKNNFKKCHYTQIFHQLYNLN